MIQQHRYDTFLVWTGNAGEGTSGYRRYSRKHTVTVGAKSPLELSADPQFVGDADRYNPEELLVASLSSCHMLWYLHLCANAGVIVTAYEDRAEGTMALDKSGDGEFAGVTLRPVVTVTASSNMKAAQSFHDEAHRRCFIARSVRFAVKHEPLVRVFEPTTSLQANSFGRRKARIS